MNRLVDGDIDIVTDDIDTVDLIRIAEKNDETTAEVNLETTEIVVKRTIDGERRLFWMQDEWVNDRGWQYIQDRHITGQSFFGQTGKRKPSSFFPTEDAPTEIGDGVRINNQIRLGEEPTFSSTISREDVRTMIYRTIRTGEVSGEGGSYQFVSELPNSESQYGVDIDSVTVRTSDGDGIVGANPQTGEDVYTYVPEYSDGDDEYSIWVRKDDE